ncbi:MAG: epoxyqueuosine reductase QueH [Lachnospiraceae bacterium]|nr:epoxyqueuosine reductase QueH [Lachnospiraceae bacterium]
MNHKDNQKPRLLLHVCCAPCSSHVLEVLTQEYEITVYFYNPNITESSEYKKRYSELERFVTEAPFAKGVVSVDGGFCPDLFFEMSEGMEDLPERGARCYECYKMRLDESARYAKENGYDIFTTSLSISPHKNAAWINEIGAMLQEKYNIDYMYSDFKKKNGYARSIQLSKEYNLYRQNYCGCIFSKKEKNNNSLV